MKLFMIKVRVCAKEGTATGTLYNGEYREAAKTLVLDINQKSANNYRMPNRVKRTNLMEVDMARYSDHTTIHAEILCEEKDKKAALDKIRTAVAERVKTTFDNATRLHAAWENRNKEPDKQDKSN